MAYHSQPALERLAHDLVHQSLLPLLWLVVDNSPDSAPLDAARLQPAGSQGERLDLELVSGQEGDGFGAGCNRGFDHLAQRGLRGWVWLLNPDTALPEGTELERLCQALDGQSARALVGTAVRDSDGRPEASGGWIDPGLDFRRRRLGPDQMNNVESLAVDWLSGCSLVLQPSAHTPPARFDPVFPLYYEDMDLCLRLARSGASVLWLPSPAVIHQRGAGSHTPSERRLGLSTLSYVLFLRRHRPGWVTLVRSLRLLFTSLLRLPLQPRRSVAVLRAMLAACR
ncbi:glycosyltransferase family 2 protein [Cyanobium sp. Morenito 9A2]|uniref:glycosyltransferase family 2 protein n=1 Tax=Cyanobium sp. Morenito 9A2 TaxID=2823718 RepID=UPI0020CF4BB5|nr:glycosyltransferase family 2 protein [Cyanobium sp. Morenito 9A2]